MIPFLVDGPQLEPVSLQEAKFWLRRDETDEDSLIQALIISARLVIEAEIGQVLLGQNWRLIGDHWPAEEAIAVRVGHLLAITGGRVFPASGSAETLLPGEFEMIRRPQGDAVRALRKPAPGRPRAGIEIDIRLGFGEVADAVPEPLRLAIRMLVAHWFEHRGDLEDEARGLPSAVLALVRPFRTIRL